MKIWKDYKFDSAHLLPNVPDGHKCGRLHGHTYRVRVYIEGGIDNSLGWVMDFGEVSAAIKPIIEKLDHRLLNEIPGLENPTSEILARWVFDNVSQVIPVSAVEVSETCETGVLYEPH